MAWLLVGRFRTTPTRIPDNFFDVDFLAATIKFIACLGHPIELLPHFGATILFTHFLQKSLGEHARMLKVFGSLNELKKY
jgi:hypothetical protein